MKHTMSKNDLKKLPAHSSTEFRYYAAKVAHRDGITGITSMSAEEDLKGNRRLMLALSRDQYQNNPLYQGTIDALVGACIGEDGAELLINLPTEHKALADQIKAKMESFFRKPEVSESMSFTEVEREVLTQMLVAGELVSIKVRGKLQLVESERIHDIPADKYGKPIKFQVYAGTTGLQTETFAENQAIYTRWRARKSSQLRGNGILWGSIPIANMMMQILNACARGWWTVALYGMVLKGKDAPAGLAAMMQSAAGAASDESGVDESEEADIEESLISFDTDGANIFAVDDKHDVTPLPQKDLPNEKLGEHLLTFMRVMLAPLQMDAATTVLSDFSKLNFSSTRAAKQLFAETISRLQNIMRHQWYHEVYRWKVGQFIASGEIVLPAGMPIEYVLFADNWILPKPQINGKEAAEESGVRIDRGLTTFDEELMADNKDPQQHVELIATTITRAIEKAKEIKDSTGVDVPWEYFAGRTPSKTEQAFKAANNGASNADAGTTQE